MLGIIGLLIALIGLMSVIKPLRFLGIKNRWLGAGVLVSGLFVLGVDNVRSAIKSKYDPITGLATAAKPESLANGGSGAAPAEENRSPVETKASGLDEGAAGDQAPTPEEDGTTDSVGRSAEQGAPEEGATEEDGGVDDDDALEDEDADTEPAPPELEPGRSWQEVRSWKGKGVTQTEPFAVASKDWRIRWETDTAPFAGSGIFQVTVYREDGSLVSLAVNKLGIGSDVAYVSRRPGRYYLVINSANVDWSVAVDDQR